VVFFDALRVKIRDEGVVRNKAIYLALGVRPDGTREVLGLWSITVTAAKIMHMLNNKYLIKASLTLMVVAVIGLPVNTLLHFTLLVAALVSIVALPVADFTSRKAMVSILTLATVIILNHSLPRAAIEEGHNLFLADVVRSNLLSDSLPAFVYSRLKKQFDQIYPLDKRCDPHIPGCWRSVWGGRTPIKTAYAQSLDDVFRKAKYSRVVDQIDFSGLADLRGGFVNEIYYHWWGHDIDIKRASMPYFVMYELNERIVDSLMCWSGEVLWEQEQGHFEPILNESFACKTITSSDIGKRLYGLGVDPAHPLAMQLQPNAKLKFFGLVREGIKLFALVTLLMLSLRWDEWRNLLFPAIFIGATGIIARMYVPEMFHGYTILIGGNDGLTHEGYGREILRHLQYGNLVNALRGEEDMFYFMPGMRYFRALGLVVFGETNFGYLAVMLTLPLAVYGVARLLLPRYWSFAVLTLGSSLIFQCLSMARAGYADPLGYTLFLSALVLILNPASKLESLWFGHFVLALSVFVRPNLVIAALLLILVQSWQTTRLMSLRAAFLSTSGFGVILLVPMHNYVFGHRFVPLTAAANISENLKAPPSAYIQAIKDAVSGNWASENLEVIVGHLHKFGSSWAILCLLLGLAAWAYRRRVQTYMSNGLLLVTLGMFLPFLFYDASLRYRMLAWLCAIIVGVGYIFMLRIWPRNTALDVRIKKRSRIRT